MIPLNWLLLSCKLQPLRFWIIALGMRGLGPTITRVYILALVVMPGYFNAIVTDTLIVILIGYGALRPWLNYNTLCGFVTIMPSLVMPVGIPATWQPLPAACVAHHTLRTSFTSSVTAPTLKRSGSVRDLVPTTTSS